MTTVSLPQVPLRSQFGLAVAKIYLSGMHYVVRTLDAIVGLFGWIQC